ncbi:thioesterase II family protein [Streptacidiphilus albus]|uniref:thioesterase II family protein n=1 Tax=Streptacidiphilus albus TaxID=105425 RepID=UPI00054B6AC6|nr:alpha/beta fold hydrolase [Streptacidiphilus albus]
MTTIPSPQVPWLRCLEPRPTAPLRLILLPHAGGSSSLFRDWPAALPPDIEAWAVQYPGRERRTGEPLPDDLGALARELATVSAPLLDRPTGVFGHSMGAGIGYEMLRVLESEQAPVRPRIRPVHLFASARQAPHRPRGRMVHQLPDEEFCEVLRSNGGVNGQVLDDPELRELFLPIIRSDYRMSETHRPTPVTPPLRVDLTVLTGAEDRAVDPAEAAHWAEAASGSFRHDVLPGDHFYLVPQLATVAAVVAERLRASAAAPAR